MRQASRAFPLIGAGCRFFGLCLSSVRLLQYRTAADHDVAVVKHKRLACRDSPLRFIKYDANLCSGNREDLAGCFAAAVSYSAVTSEIRLRRVKRDPVHVLCNEFASEQVRVFTQDHAVVFKVFFYDIHRMSEG